MTTPTTLVAGEKTYTLQLNTHSLCELEDKQFDTIVAALERMEDPQERNRLGVELFGKSFATIAPAVAAGYSEMAASAQVSSAAQIKAIDDAADALDRFVAKQKTRVTSILGDVAIAAEEFSKLTTMQQAALLVVGSRNQLDLETQLLKMARARASQIDINLPKEKAQADSAASYSAELAKEGVRRTRAGGRETRYSRRALQLHAARLICRTGERDRLALNEGGAAAEPSLGCDPPVRGEYKNDVLCVRELEVAHVRDGHGQSEFPPGVGPGALALG
jgi:ribosome-associated translation inhibitor RaiA